MSQFRHSGSTSGGKVVPTAAMPSAASFRANKSVRSRIGSRSQSERPPGKGPPRSWQAPESARFCHEGLARNGRSWHLLGRSAVPDRRSWSRRRQSASRQSAGSDVDGLPASRHAPATPIGRVGARPCPCHQPARGPSPGQGRFVMTREAAVEKAARTLSTSRLYTRFFNLD
jgi:hypothetical protein